MTCRAVLLTRSFSQEWITCYNACFDFDDMNYQTFTNTAQQVLNRIYERLAPQTNLSINQ